VVNGREPIGLIEGKKRVSFALREVALVPGRYYVSIGMKRESGSWYHAQTQAYWFEVEDEQHSHDIVQHRVDAYVEDL